MENVVQLVLKCDIRKNSGECVKMFSNSNLVSCHVFPSTVDSLLLATL